VLLHVYTHNDENPRDYEFTNNVRNISYLDTKWKIVLAFISQKNEQILLARP